MRCSSDGGDCRNERAGDLAGSRIPDLSDWHGPPKPLLSCRDLELGLAVWPAESLAAAASFQPAHLHASAQGKEGRQRTPRAQVQ